MIKLVEAIIEKELLTANQIFEAEIATIVSIKLEEAKKIVAAYDNDITEDYDENRWYKERSERVLNRLKDVKNSIDGVDKALSNNIQKKVNLVQRRITQNDAVNTKTGFRGTIGSQDMYPTYRSASKNMNKAMSQAGMNNEEIELTEEELEEARIKIIRARIRGGKLQRRKKVSNVPGYTFRGGKMTRMSPQERRKRRMGQRRGKIKRKAKLQRALMKRKRSMRRRAAMGI